MGSDAAAAAIEARARDRTAIAVRGEAPVTRVVRAAGTARHGPCATVDVICETAFISITRGEERRGPRIAISNRRMRAWTTWTVARGSVRTTV